MQYAIVEVHMDEDCYVTNAAIFETELTDPKEILMAYVPKIEIGNSTNALYVFINGHQYAIEDSYFTGKWKFYDLG